MNEKCTKYEALFTFRSEEELNEHIQHCENCKIGRASCRERV